jgi:hypothetical protein
MYKRAEGMGFKPLGMDQSLFLLVPDYVERQPVSLAPASAPTIVSAPVLPPEYTESLFEWLRKEIMRSSFPFLTVKQ